MGFYSGYLRIWLGVVAVARVSGVYLMLFKPEFYRTAMYALQPEQATDLFSRLSGVWTSMSLVLCLLCAYDVRSTSIRLALLYSFSSAAAHFLTEALVFKTGYLANASSTLAFAVPSAIWLAADLIADYTNPPAPKGKHN